MITVAQQTFKVFQGLLLFPYFEQGVDEPKGTNGKRGRRQSKVILVLVSVQQTVVAQSLFDCFNGVYVLWVLGMNKPVGLH